MSGPGRTEPTSRPTARQLIDLVLDKGSWESWDEPVTGDIGGGTYATELAAAERRSGETESVVTGVGTRDGVRIAVVAGEFRFLAGSIGVAAARRLVTAIRRATDERLPMVAAPSSGGTRMQEGSAAFVRMVDISLAVSDHKAAGLPFLVYLRHPTTGGVMASWGSLGHVTVGEPGALLGFLGPRVYGSLHGRPFPDGVQTSENLLVKGLIDGVAGPGQVGALLDRALRVLRSSRNDLPGNPVDGEIRDVDAWESVTCSRNPRRPGVRRLLRHAATDVVPFGGAGRSDADPGLLLAFARFGGTPCVVVGQDRHRQRAGHLLGPAALRKARRGMRLASELRLPLLTVIDTPGAALSREAEEGGLAGEIARSLADMVTLEAPTLALLLGEGAGGAALALLPGDYVVAAQHAWLSPLLPEGASVIVHRDPSHAPELARSQGVRSLDLRTAGIVDRIVPEKPDAASEPVRFCRRLGEVLRYELATLVAVDAKERMLARRTRYGGPGHL